MDPPPPSPSAQTTSLWAPTKWRLSSTTAVETTSSFPWATPQHSLPSQVLPFYTTINTLQYLNHVLWLYPYNVVFLPWQIKSLSPSHSTKLAMSTRMTRASSRTEPLPSTWSSMTPASTSAPQTSPSTGTLVTKLEPSSLGSARWLTHTWHRAPTNPRWFWWQTFPRTVRTPLPVSEDAIRIPIFFCSFLFVTLFEPLFVTFQLLIWYFKYHIHNPL